MLISFVVHNEDQLLGPMSPCVGLRRSETAHHAVPVYACDWITSQRYWISSGLPAGLPFSSPQHNPVSVPRAPA